MATILQFAERLADDQDWTASERAQLRDVGAQLDGVDVVFGKSEAGDPWCVVTDEGGEVMLHVARIGREFVVHATREDEVVQDDDLWSAARRILGDMLKERRGVLLAFPPEALGQTAVLAFLFAAAMRGEFDHWIPASSPLAPSAPPSPTPAVHGEAAPPEQSEDHRASSHDETHSPDDRGGAIKEAAPDARPEAKAPAAQEAGPAHQDQPPPAEDETAPARKTQPSVATAPDPGDARTQGTHTDFAAFGGPGRSSGAGSGGAATATGTATGGDEAAGQTSSQPHAPLTEFVQGGDGDDRIAMAENVAATGGRGADTFVLTLPGASPPAMAATSSAAGSGATASGPAAAAGAPKLMGVIGDFHAAEGDRLELSGHAVVVVDRAEVDLLSPVRARTGSGDAPVLSGRHIGYDVDGDGQEDAYVLVTNVGGGWFASARTAGSPVGGGGTASHGVTLPSPGAMPGTALIPGAEGPQAPIALTGEASHPPAGPEFGF